jgi:hypothetical protein
MTNPTIAILHFTAALPIPAEERCLFLKALESLGNDSLWTNIHIKGDGDWITMSLHDGSLKIAHDGSYMSDASLDLCSEEVILYCTSSQQWGKISVVKQSLSENNYRGELLGAVILQYIIWAATFDLPLSNLSMTLSFLR